MRRRLIAVIGAGFVLAAILTGSVFARDITSNTSPKVDYRVSGLAHSVESEDSESQSVYIDLSNRQGPSEDDAQ